MSKRRYWIVGTLLVLGASLWYYLSSPATPVYSNIRTTHSVLIEKNAEYRLGKERMQAGDYKGALTAFKAALPLATDSVQRGHIEYNIANTVAASGDVMGAIPLFKNVAANTEYRPDRRSGAVTALGSLYYRAYYRTPEHVRAITQEIFKDAPYQALFTAGDDALSYRMLFEYASNFAPLALPELYSARWYAENLLSQKGKIEPSSEEVSSAIENIRRKLRNAEADIEYMGPNQNQHWMIPVALEEEALVSDLLVRSGFETHLPSVSATTTEAAYTAAITTYEQYRTYTIPEGSDGVARFRYASFLAYKYGTVRRADIQSLLAPLYTNAAYNESRVTVFLKTVPTRTDVLREKNDAKRLAGFDVGFKKYLGTLGWTSKDFK